MYHDIQISNNNHKIPAYRSVSGGDGPRPALILIHEVWGLTDHIREVADRLAGEGYDVVAPDLFEGTELGRLLTPELVEALADPARRSEHQTEFRALMAPLSSPEFGREIRARVKAVFEFLAAGAQVTKIGAIGFCFGGSYSFALAVDAPKLSAAVVFYGHIQHSPEELAQIKCPILAFYGDQDSRSVEPLPELVGQIEAAQIKFRHKIYPDTGHAFFNDTNQATYRPEAATDAWAETLAFLGAELSG